MACNLTKARERRAASCLATELPCGLRKRGGIMYPVSIGYAGAIQRINELLRNGHDAEALVTTAFTIEKTLRRTLRQLVVSAGFRSTDADKIV